MIKQLLVLEGAFALFDKAHKPVVHFGCWSSFY